LRGEPTPRPRRDLGRNRAWRGEVPAGRPRRLGGPAHLVAAPRGRLRE
jgi:hypothetical protein